MADIRSIELIELGDLQSRLYDWQIDNFGAMDSFNLALGVYEETGELAHAVLKRSQGIRGYDDLGKAADAIADALADAAIYALNLASSRGHNIRSIALREKPRQGGAEYYLTEITGRAASIVEYRGGGSLIPVFLADLAEYAESENIDFKEALFTTAEKVMQRDWNKNKTDGGDGSRPCFDEDRAIVCPQCVNAEHGVRRIQDVVGDVLGDMREAMKQDG